MTPVREGLVGTNRIHDGRGALDVTWSHAAIPHMKPFVTDWRAVETLFEAFVAGESLVDPDVRAVFEPFDLFDDEGRLTIPIVVADSTDPVHRAGLRIATVLTDRVPEALDLPGMVERFGFRDEPQALVVAYHELMWDVLDVLVRRGVVVRPAILDGAAESPAEVAALVYGVRPGP